MKTSIVTKELKRIAAKHGGLLRPATVVAEARPKTSPLHSRFEWSDNVAAHQYRLWQARQLISVTVEVVEGMKEKTSVFVSLRSDREKGGYRVMTEVLSDADRRKQLLQDALLELNSFQEKYRSLKALADLFREIKKLRKAA